MAHSLADPESIGRTDEAAKRLTIGDLAVSRYATPGEDIVFGSALAVIVIVGSQVPLSDGAACALRGDCSEACKDGDARACIWLTMQRHGIEPKRTFLHLAECERGSAEACVWALSLFPHDLDPPVRRRSLAFLNALAQKGGVCAERQWVTIGDCSNAPAQPTETPVEPAESSKCWEQVGVRPCDCNAKWGDVSGAALCSLSQCRSGDRAECQTLLWQASARIDWVRFPSRRATPEMGCVAGTTDFAELAWDEAHRWLPKALELELQDCAKGDLSACEAGLEGLKVAKLAAPNELGALTTVVSSSLEEGCRAGNPRVCEARLREQETLGAVDNAGRAAMAVAACRGWPSGCSRLASNANGLERKTREELLAIACEASGKSVCVALEQLSPKRARAVARSLCERGDGSACYRGGIAAKPELKVRACRLGVSQACNATPGE